MQQQEWMNEWFYSKIALNIQQRWQQVVQTEEKKCGPYGCMFCLLISFRQLDLGWVDGRRKEKRGFLSPPTTTEGNRIKAIFMLKWRHTATSQLNQPNECSNVHWNFHSLSLSSLFEHPWPKKCKNRWKLGIGSVMVSTHGNISLFRQVEFVIPLLLLILIAPHSRTVSWGRQQEQKNRKQFHLKDCTWQETKIEENFVLLLRFASSMWQSTSLFTEENGEESRRRTAKQAGKLWRYKRSRGRRRRNKLSYSFWTAWWVFG